MMTLRRRPFCLTGLLLLAGLGSCTHRQATNLTQGEHSMRTLHAVSQRGLLLTFEGEPRGESRGQVRAWLTSRRLESSLGRNSQPLKPNDISTLPLRFSHSLPANSSTQSANNVFGVLRVSSSDFHAQLSRFRNCENKKMVSYRTTSASLNAPRTLLVRDALRPTARAISLVLRSLFSARSCTTAKATGFPRSRHRRDCL